MFDLSTYLRDKQLLADNLLELLLRQETTSPAALVEAMRYSLLAPGKRIRPRARLHGAARRRAASTIKPGRPRVPSR